MERINSDELILTSEGKIYHLDILPKNLSNVIIMVGDPQRVALITQFFDSIEFTNSHREYVISTGYYRDVRLTAMSSGIGTQNIDIVLNELDALVNIDFEHRRAKKEQTQLRIFRLGTSGSIQADIPVGSFVIATHGIDMTGVMSYYFVQQSTEELQLTEALRNYLQVKYPIIPVDIYSGSNELIQLFRSVKKYKFGITGACNGFYAPQGRELRANSRIKGIEDYLSKFSWNSKRVMNFEMETGTIYGFGHVLGHQCCSINAILANRITNNFVNDIESLVTDCIKLSLDRIVSPYNQ